MKLLAYLLVGSSVSAIGAIWLGLGFEGGLVAFFMFPAFALTAHGAPLDSAH